MSRSEGRLSRTRALAGLWHKIVMAEPIRLPDGCDWLRSGGESDRIAQPGFVGSRFEQRGTLLLAMNPGGRAEGDTGDDRRYFEALKRLQDAADPVPSFVEWNTVFCDVARTWKYY